MAGITYPVPKTDITQSFGLISTSANNVIMLHTSIDPVQSQTHVKRKAKHFLWANEWLVQKSVSL